MSRKAIDDTTAADAAHDGDDDDDDDNNAADKAATCDKQPQEDEEEDRILFRCESDHPKVLIGLLMSFGYLGLSNSSSKKSSQIISSSSASQRHSSSISGRANTTSTPFASHESSLGQMTIWPNDNGLQIHQAPNLQSQASLDLPKEFFSLYQITSTSTSTAPTEPDDSNCCCISWKPFRNALQLALSQNPSKLALTYNLRDEVLHIETECLFSSGSVLCTALLGGLVPPDDSDTPQLSQAFLSQQIAARVLVPSSLFVDIHELNSVSPIAIQLTWKPPKKRKNNNSSNSNNTSILQATAVGACSECTIQWQVPMDWPVTDQKQLRFRYPFLAWNQAMKPSFDNQAHETCISVNQQGILAIQHQLLCHDNIAAFCDGLLLPLIEEDDDEEEEEKEYYGIDDHDDNTTTATFTSNQTQEERQYRRQDNNTPAYSPSPTNASRRSQPSLLDNNNNHNNGCGSSQDDEDDDDDDEEKEQEQEATSSVFFGSLSMEETTTGITPGTSQRRRRAQRKRLRQQQRQSLSEQQQEQQHATASPDRLMQSQSSNDDYDDDDDDDDNGHEQDRYCSSPEVVYGKM